MNGAFTFVAGTSGCSGGMFIEDVATHEFGHALAAECADKRPGHDQRRERSTSQSSWTQSPGLSKDTTSYLASGLSANTTYYFRVRANNSATSVNENSDLSWIGDAQTYDVYFWQGPPTQVAQLYKSGLTSAFLSLPKLKQGVQYSWQVVAKNTAGSTPGPVWSFTTRTKTTGKPR